VADVEDITAHYAEEEGDATCPGNLEEPTAPPGFLCRYKSSESTMSGVGGTLYSSGMILRGEEFLPSDYLFGSFAVTAPEAP
jgi:hypothetical protein